MRKTNSLILFCLFMASQLFAQQAQTQAEHWFGVKPQSNMLKNTKATSPKASAKAGLRSTSADANGIITLDLNNPLNPSSFELDADGVWTGTFNDEDYTFIELNSPFAFSHLYDGAGAAYGGYYWDGFTYSKNGSNADQGQGDSSGWVANQWGNMAGGGIKTDAEGNVMKDEHGVVITDPDAPYLVAYWGFGMEPEYFDYLYWGANLTEPAHNLQTIFTDGNTYQAVGMYVNNHPWPYYGNLNGDGFAQAFTQDGDYFKLIVHGLDQGFEETGTSVEHYLAKYENGTLTQSTDWEWVDLSALGEIGGLYYTMESSDSDPILGPNTAVYFCMDKLQIRKAADVSITMNAVSTTMVLKNKDTNEEVNIGTPTGNKYNFKAYSGDYVLSAYSGTTLNGTIELTITEEATQVFQFYTITSYASNSGWTLEADYNINASVSSREGAPRTITLGTSTTAGRAAFLVYSGDTYLTRFTPSASRQAEGYLTSSTSATATGNVNATRAIPMGYSYTVIAPAEATVFVGFPDYSGYYFRPFTQIVAENVSTEGENKVYTYKIAGSQACAYRISQSGKTTYASVFTKAASDQTLTITSDMLEGDPKRLDTDVSSNNGFNVSDVYLNINERGHLKLSSGDTHQIVNIRAWQTNNNITGNLFIEPDFHYTVIDESGAVNASVVTVDEKGLLTAVGAGTAIVLVTYDAINVSSAAGGPFFSAIWPENTGVFVVSVDAVESGISPNMTINETLNASIIANKNAGINVDAELDVFYYTETEGGYDYTFTPAGAISSVSLAQPVVGANMTTYAGFSTDKVTDNEDGSYTVSLTHGRNIVKLASAGGEEYQVLTAKETAYTITNASRYGEKFQPGDEVSVRFNTLYHPSTKLAGIYNMSAYIRYEVNGSAVTNTAGNQYAFASNAASQTYSATIPTDWDTENDFTFTNGVIRDGATSGMNYGDPFGNHRLITLETGRNPNFTAALRMAYFGALPDVSISWKTTTGLSQNTSENVFSVYPGLFSDYIIVNTSSTENIVMYDLSGKVVLKTKSQKGNNRIETSALPKGIYVLKCGEQTVKVIK